MALAVSIRLEDSKFLNCLGTSYISLRDRLFDANITVSLAIDRDLQIVIQLVRIVLLIQLALHLIDICLNRAHFLSQI